MGTTTSNKRQSLRSFGQASQSEYGFTMIEMIAAMLILMIGLIALASAIGYALMASNRGRNVTNTKLLIVSVLEEIETLRNTKQLAFKQIANVGAVDNNNVRRSFGGFSTGFQPVAMNPTTKQMNYGPDGIVGTPDDQVTPGSNGIYGDSDDTTDTSLTLSGYERQIVITTLPGNTTLKKIEVTLRYPGRNGATETLTGTSYLNDDARSNFLR
ncbi:MAG: prepilin-type N-terminal cleavage/methylation domain-containing protein [Pyrinomonadaceae bacterium]